MLACWPETGVLAKVLRKVLFLWSVLRTLRIFDDRQITHLIRVRLRHVLYDFFRGCFGHFI